MSHRYRFSEAFPIDALRTHLAPRTWQPIPPAADRSFWDKVDAPDLLELAESTRGTAWPALPAALWLDFVRTGNRLHFEDPHFARRDRLAAAVVAACLTDSQDWYDEVIDGVWLICEETTWCLPPHDWHAHIPGGTVLPDPQRPCLDLFAAETGALLAWTHAVLADRLRRTAPILPRRIVDEVTRRVLVPHRTVDDGIWLGRRPHVNNWTPWINSNALVCTLFLDTDPADVVLTTARAVEGLDGFLRGYPDDGGCDEGQSYWWRAGASLGECLEYLRSASAGALDGFDMPLVREMVCYPHRVHIADNWYVNVGDGPARLDPLNASAHLLWLLGRRVGDADVQALGRWLRDQAARVGRASIGRSLGRTLLALADADWSDVPATAPPLPAQTWLPDTKLLTARETAGSTDGLFVSLIGSDNGLSHNHNDVGSFIVGVDGKPAIVDAGVGDYRRETFGPQRYSIWTMRSDYHSVPSVDGIEQGAGRDFHATDVSASLTEASASVSLDLSSAYPSDAGIDSWRRDLTLDRSAHRVTLSDSWQLDHDPQSIVLHLITSAEPQVDGALAIPTPSRPLIVEYDAAQLAVAAEVVEYDDRRLRNVWGDRLWRVTLAVRHPARTGSWTLTMHA